MNNFSNVINRECIIRDSSEIIITENGNAVLYKDFENSDNSKFMTSNIFAARIVEYAPQLHSFFVDIGDGSRRGILASRGESFRVGDFCIVQISSSPRSKKGAQLSSNIRLSGSKTVLLPTEDELSVNISGKIFNSGSRERLELLGESILDDKSKPRYSMIFRTECENLPSKEIIADYDNLCFLWKGILDEFSAFVSEGRVGLLYGRDPILAEILKYPISSYSAICVDSVEMMDIIKNKIPRLSPVLKFIPNRIFEAKSVDNVRACLLGRKVFLKSGGNIVIEKTEALTVIDVNTGKSLRSYSCVNFEAAFEIMRQLRLRDIGGIIVCDFIEPEDKKDRLALVEYMRELALVDPSKPEIPGISQLGLIEISRKRS